MFEYGIRVSRAPRACARCAYVRTVKITVWGGNPPSWAELCGICELESRARLHRQQAAIFERRAFDLRAKRAARGAAK